MRIDIVSLFPEMFDSYFQESMLKKVQEMGLVEIGLHSIRAHATDKHRITDEPPYGGGGGMILKAPPIFSCIEAIPEWEGARRILMTPQGRPLTQEIAESLAKETHLILLCGRYEGVDERVREHLVTDELSIGDYVLTGGELAAMVIVDAVSRLLPGALGAEGAAEQDSHATGLLEGGHYTKPAVFREWEVPELLRSGHEAKIQRWRREESLRRTWERRPEMLLTAVLSEEDRHFLAVLAGNSNSTIE